MNTDIYTVAAAVESTDPAAIFLAICGTLLFLFAFTSILIEEDEIAGLLLFLGAFVGVIFLMVNNATNQWDEENREIIAYSYNLEFTDPQQDIPDDRGTTEGYVLLNDTETVEYCVFGRNATSDEDIDTLTVTCDGEPRPVREHLQER